MDADERRFARERLGTIAKPRRSSAFTGNRA
jgi:hypothetical protein